MSLYFFFFLFSFLPGLVWHNDDMIGQNGTWQNNDIITMEVDMGDEKSEDADLRKLVFFKNKQQQPYVFVGLPKNIQFGIGAAGNNAAVEV
jgi:hypothetical protein